MVFSSPARPPFSVGFFNKHIPHWLCSSCPLPYVPTTRSIFEDPSKPWSVTKSPAWCFGTGRYCSPVFSISPAVLSTDDASTSPQLMSSFLRKLVAAASGGQYRSRCIILHILADFLIHLLSRDRSSPTLNNHFYCLPDTDLKISA